MNTMERANGTGKSRSGYATPEVVERLRKSRDQENADNLSAGKDTGREWAANRAGYHQLARLARHAERHGEVLAVSCSPGVEVYRITVVDGDGPALQEDNAREWWSELLGYYHHYFADDPAWLTGFVTGALEVFQEVKEALGEAEATAPF